MGNTPIKSVHLAFNSDCAEYESKLIELYDAKGIEGVIAAYMDLVKNDGSPKFKNQQHFYKSGELEEWYQIEVDRIKNGDSINSEEEALILKLYESGDIEKAIEIFFDLLKEKKYASYDLISQMSVHFISGGLDDCSEDLLSHLENIWPSRFLDTMRLLYFIGRNEMVNVRKTYKSLTRRGVFKESLGEYLHNFREYEQAYKELTLQITKRSDDIKSRELLIPYELGRYRYSESKKLAIRILKSNKKNVVALCALARVAISDDDYKTATDYLGKVANIDKNNKDFHLVSAAVLFFKGQYRNAITHARRAANLDTGPSGKAEIARLSILLLCQLKLEFYEPALDTYRHLQSAFTERYDVDLDLIPLSKVNVDDTSYLRNDLSLVKSIITCYESLMITEFKGSEESIKFRFEHLQAKQSGFYEKIETSMEEFNRAKHFTSRPFITNRNNTNISVGEEISIQIDWSSIIKIQLSLKNTFSSELKSHFVTLSTESQDLPPVHLEPTCFSLLWFLILHHEGSKRNDVSPFNYFKTDRWWSNINKIWKAVHGDTYYSHIHEVVDLKESITPMSGFIEIPEIIEKIEEGGVGGWVIDIRRKRRGNYLSKIKKIIKGEASIGKIPKDLFICDSTFKEFDSHWNGLYKLNDKYFWSIKLETPDL